jgi:hypothetical protein
MSSYVGFAQNPQYVLPFQTEAVPSSMKSNLAPRPINCTISTVSVPATSGAANAGGLSTIQIPLGNAAYMANPYLRFKLAVTGAGDTARGFKGFVQAASSAISSYQTSINSTLIDNVLNYSQVSDLLFAHACSSNYLTKDGSVLFNALTTTPTGAGNLSETYVIPLLGLLGSQAAMPLWLIQGVLSINVNWASLGAMFGSAVADGNIATATFSDVALVYDRITVEGDFIAKMKADMMATGAKYVYNFTSYQSLSNTVAAGAGQSTINTGINVSSLRAVTLTSHATAGLTLQNNLGASIRNATSQFQVSLDGRMISNTPIDAVSAPAGAFAELNKCFSRLFDSAVDDISTKASYLDGAFAVGVNCCRVAEGLSFQGSPCSVISVALTQAPAAASTNFLTFISDQSLLIGADGAVDLVR